MTTAKERFEVLGRLQRAGFTEDEAHTLRRIALTLHRWHTGECGTNNGGIERDEATGVPYWTYDTGEAERGRYRILDREKGALARLKVLMQPYKRRFIPYVQGDPRGASLYLVPMREVRRHKGTNIDGYYSQGIAVY